MTARRLLMLGPPGVGKGTQAERLMQKLGVPQISTGQMLRDAVAAKTAVGLAAQAVMARGDLVSDEIVIAVAEQRLAAPDARRGFILDGFPRTPGQAAALDAMLARLGTPLERCIALTVDEEQIVRRLIKRAQIEGRSDDSEETVRKRLKVYHAQTEPLIAHYTAQGIVRAVDGDASVEEVGKRIEEALS
jgi:adenylate kinase